MDVSSLLRKHTEKWLVLRGSAEELSLQTAPNEITVTVDGHASAVSVLTLLGGR